MADAQNQMEQQLQAAVQQMQQQMQAQLQAQQQQHAQDMQALLAQLQALQQQQAAAPPPAPAPAPAQPPQAPKPPKPPKLEKDTDYHIQDWLTQMEAYLRACGILATQAAVVAAAPYLTGRYLVWYEAQMATQPGATAAYPTWADFKTALTAQFVLAPPDKTALRRLDTLVQTRAAKDYAAEFNRHLAFLPTLPMDARVHMFVRGLKPEVRKEVELKLADRPPGKTTLEEAQRVALVADDVLYTLRLRRTGGYPPGPHGPSGAADGKPSGGGGTGPAPMELGAADAAPAPGVRVCYWCGKPNHMQRDCRRFKAYMAGDKSKTKLYKGPGPGAGGHRPSAHPN